VGAGEQRRTTARCGCEAGPTRLLSMVLMYTYSLIIRGSIRAADDTHHSWAQQSQHGEIIAQQHKTGGDRSCETMASHHGRPLWGSGGGFRRGHSAYIENE
jgi:hypothetical protein